MSELIFRGVKNPANCSECFFWSICPCLAEFDGYSAILDSVHDGNLVRHEECPLVPLPEGHGRLIDANKVTDAKFLPEVASVSEYARGWNDALDAIKENAPSIIQPETKPVEAAVPELQACPYCKQKPTIRKWGHLYRAECEQYACSNPYAAHGQTNVDCVETWNAFVTEIERDLEKEDEERRAEDDK